MTEKKIEKGNDVDLITEQIYIDSNSSINSNNKDKILSVTPKKAAAFIIREEDSKLFKSSFNFISKKS